MTDAPQDLFLACLNVLKDRKPELQTLQTQKQTESNFVSCPLQHSTVCHCVSKCMSVSLFSCKFVSATQTHIPFSLSHTNQFDCKFHTVIAYSLPAARYFELASATVNIYIYASAHFLRQWHVSVLQYTNTVLCKLYTIILIIQSDRQARLKAKKLINQL